MARTSLFAVAILSLAGMLLSAAPPKVPRERAAKRDWRDRTGTLQLEDCLHVALALCSLDETKKLDYTGWAPGGIGRRVADAQWATLIDEHGNAYKPLGHVFGLARQRDEGAAIRPGEDTAETLYFERPIAAATRLTLTLPGAAIGVDGSLTLQLPANDAAEQWTSLRNRVAQTRLDVHALELDTKPPAEGEPRVWTERFWKTPDGWTIGRFVAFNKSSPAAKARTLTIHWRGELRSYLEAALSDADRRYAELAEAARLEDEKRLSRPTRTKSKR
jgi:hypothetical protein